MILISKSKLFFDSIKSLCRIIGIYGLIIDPAMSANLPSGYTELEYLQSSGTQYVDTGYKSSSNVKTELKFSPTAYAGAVYGNYSVNSSVNKSNTLYVSQQNVSTVYVTDLGGTTGGSENRTKIADLTLNSTYEVSVDLKNREATANGITTNLLNTNVWTGTYNLPLFARTDASGVIGYYGQLKLFYFRLYDNGVLVRNFIPAKRDSDNVVGMYDMVNNTFYTNSGTGTFTAGPVVESPEIKIATTKYVEDKFANSVSELNTTMGTIKNVVDNTIIQADRIGKLQTGKQTRPAENCPDGAQCLLITEADGSLHWYPICNADGTVGTQSSN